MKLSTVFPISKPLFCTVLLYLSAFHCLPMQAMDSNSSEPTAPKAILRSSVSEEFRQGLHEKYLLYLADKLDMQLHITPMTYSRRLASLRDGTIDIMTGLRDTFEENDDFVYLQPSYITTDNRYFVRSNSDIDLTDTKDLRGLTIAITVDEKTHIDNLNKLGATTLIIPSLNQKIKLLMRERIDAFEHYEYSGLLRLIELGLQQDIKTAALVSEYQLKFHFALSTQSPLITQQAAIEAIIAAGVKNGDFDAIRSKHYQAINDLK